MFDKCFAKILTTANGKPLTQAQRDMLRDRFSAAFLANAQAGSQSGDAIMKALADMKQQQIHDAKLRQYRETRNVLAQMQIKGFADANADKFSGGKAAAVWRMIATHSDRKSNIQSVESYRNALERKYSPIVHEISRAIGTETGGFIENAQNAYLFTKALFNDSANIPPELVAKYAEMQPLAKKWLDMAESLRQQFNKAGGDVGKLDDWVMPQSWDGKKLREVKADDWIAEMLDHIDRSKYIDDETGLRMDEDQVKEVLRSAYRNITTEGGPTTRAGAVSGVQNRGRAERVLHLKNADSFVAMQGKYGQHSLQMAMYRHTSNMSTNIALTSKLGPGYHNNVMSVIADARKALADEVATSQDWAKLKAFDLTASRAELAMLDMAGSTVAAPPPGRLVTFLQGMRNLSSNLLGGAYISSLTDNANAQAYARLNKISGTDLIVENLRNLNPADETRAVQMQNAGLVPEVYLHAVYSDVNQMLRAGWTKGLSDVSMKLGLMPIATRARSAAFGASMQNAIGAKTRKFKDLADVKGADGDIMRGLGVTDSDWKVWTVAKPEKFGDWTQTYLTPNSIYDIPDADLIAAMPAEFAGVTDTAKHAAKLKEDAVIKLLGTVDSESRAAILQPGINVRSLMQNQAYKGTIPGEIWASVAQFKQFPFAIIEQTIMRMKGLSSNSDRLAFAGIFAGGTTLMGGLIIQANNLLNGKDPEDMAKPSFVARAALKGGALGMVGDALFMDERRWYQFIAGPSAGAVITGAEVFTRPMRRAVDGQETDYADMGGDIVRLVNQYNPAAKLWYSRGAYDHMVTHNIQESLSPGYLDRMEYRNLQKYGNKYWWQPGEATPDRLPDASEMWEVD